MLHWAYIAITACLAVLILVELFREQKWRNQIALVLILIPMVLRVLHIK